MVSKFKQTDIGLIPEDWDCLCLVDPQVGYIVNGLTYKPENVKRHGTLILRSANIKNGRLSFDDNVYVNCAIPHNLLVRKNDVLICVRNGSRALIGKSALIKQDLPVTFGAFMSVLRGNLGEYTYFLFSSNIIQKQINVNCSATINRITKRDFKSFYIPLPRSSSEQKAIAEALSDIDQLISATEKLIAKKQDIKKGLIQELLTGKRRIGIKCLSPFKSSELGDIPADWRVLKIGDTFRFLTNNTYSRSAMNSDGGTHRNIHYGDILTRYNEIVDCTYDELPFLNSDIKVRENALLHTGDIIFADTAEDETVGKAIELLNVDNRAICAGLHTVALRPHEDIFANGFLGYFLNSEAFHSSLLPYVTGIKVSSISKTTIKNSLVLCPPKEEQAAIANALRDIDQDIFSQKSKLHKLHALKAGMMSELLTGRIRLREVTETGELNE